MPRSLVIGGTLFIGRALVEQLLARGDTVVIMHRGTGTPWGARVGEIQCDRNDIAAVRAALDGEQFDFIYDNVFDWSRGTTAEQVSAAATASVKGLRRYVFTSSVAAYDPGAGERDEDAALARSDNENGYGVKKAESETALFALWRERGAHGRDVVAIALDLADPRTERRAGPAVHDDDSVAAGEQLVDEGAADEEGSADHEGASHP